MDQEPKTTNSTQYINFKDTDVKLIANNNNEHIQGDTGDTMYEPDANVQLAPSNVPSNVPLTYPLTSL